ncbi:hypothetical protein RFI_13300 [Reticulomyxa filosa]|uniref:TLDc domain-containing protein n=1 Tax=Reticulomyxa filosa TaxID=46433 RepID=X6NDC9_RETFI|nr:hypothetical protein RFI_13300 [Reticulomyxa filosa]|eukprot:ETO23868.1 hypothetical protein RFI_13300 [Reticulomyxa filosa]
MCKEAQIGWMVQADLLKVLRDLPDSCVYKEFQMKLNDRVSASGGQVILLSVEEHDKITKIEGTSKKVLERIERLQQQMKQLEDNTKLCKERVTQIYKKVVEGIVELEKQTIENIESLHEKKRVCLDEQISQLQNIMEIFKQKSTEINHCLSESELDISQRRAKLGSLLSESNLTYEGGIALEMDWSAAENDPMDINIQVQMTEDVQTVLYTLLKQNMMIRQNGAINITEAEINDVDDKPYVEVKWSMNAFSRECRDDTCMVDVEMTKQTWSQPESLEGVQELTRGRLEFLDWKLAKKVAIEGGIKKQSYNGRVTIGDEKEYEMEWNETYLIRMRACDRKCTWYTPYSETVAFKTIPPIKFHSSILTTEEEAALLSFIPERLTKVSLLYRASRHGFKARNFHSKCDGKGPTLLLVLSEKYGHVFGGYTEVPWASHGAWKKDARAFVFLLRNTKGYSPKKWRVRPEGENHAVGHNALYGPIFGSIYLPPH